MARQHHFKTVIFENVPGGFHELIVENLNGCGQVIKSFSILEAPNFLLLTTMVITTIGI
jgi:hypothetical protein